MHSQEQPRCPWVRQPDNRLRLPIPATLGVCTHRRTTTMPAPRPRSPAQVEASRRNGARSRGPVTPEGKAQSSRNTLKHGLTAMHHLVVEDEAPQELADMT